MSGEKIVRVWVGNDYLELIFDEADLAGLSEDELYQTAMEYIMSEISIEII